MLNLLRTTLLYIEEQNEWLSELQTILVKKERKYKLLHSMITKEIHDELEREKSSDSDNEEIKQTVVEIKTEAHDNTDLHNHDSNEIPCTREMLPHSIESCSSTTAMMNAGDAFQEDQFENNESDEIAVNKRTNYDLFAVKTEPEYFPEDMATTHTNIESTSSTNMEPIVTALPQEISTCTDSGSSDKNSAIIAMPPPESNAQDIIYINMKSTASQTDRSIRACKRFSDEKPHKCTYCDLCFKLIGTRLKHERIHTGEKPYKCPYCDKQFRESGTRTKHIRLHTGEKPYKCDYCDKAFAQSGNRTLHMRIHTDEKPFECAYCEKAFRQPRALKYHILRIHIDKTQSDQTMLTNT